MCLCLLIILWLVILSHGKLLYSFVMYFHNLLVMSVWLECHLSYSRDKALKGKKGEIKRTFRCGKWLSLIKWEINHDSCSVQVGLICWHNALERSRPLSVLWWCKGGHWHQLHNVVCFHNGQLNLVSICHSFIISRKGFNFNLFLPKKGLHDPHSTEKLWKNRSLGALRAATSR